MLKRDDVIAYCMTLENVYEDYPFSDINWTCMRHKENKKIFAWIFKRYDYIWVNVKGERGWLDFFREKYDSVIPGYHMHKDHWNSVILDGSVTQEDICVMIQESYALTLNSQRKKVISSKERMNNYESDF